MEFAITIKAGPVKVFTGITTTKGFKGWWAKVCDINCSIGATSVVRFLKPDITEQMCFKTIALVQDRQLIWECTENNVFESWIGTTLTFSIRAVNGHSILELVQQSPDPDWADHPDYEGSEAGWAYFLDSLKQYCETGKGNPWG